jgi:dTDP-4-amino-4,6-dideoxygalactose transaminase
MDIKWVNHKNINIENINIKINDCIKTRHITNNGMNVRQLQENIKNIFKLNINKEVLMVCNGAMGINALIGGYNIFYKKKLRWVVQAFTFPCSVQGMLMDSIVMDIDNNMGPSLEQLEKRKDEYDGIVVTNCFGCSSNILLYEKFCKDNNKILIFDNAASSMTFYNNTNHLNYGNGCMVSCHHTKPIGFGEGGFIVFDKEYLDSMKKSICFGFTDTDRMHYDVNASNYKMSEIACIYLSDYLNNVETIYNHHTELIEYFIMILNKNNIKYIKLFDSYAEYNNSLLACIPIIFESKELADEKYKLFIENKIEAKKYYFPLDFNCINSVDLFNRIICLPLNIDINKEIINKYINFIL